MEREKKDTMKETKKSGHAKNWKEYTATVEDIERFLSDHVVLRRNVVTGRTECRIPESDVFADWMAEGLPTVRDAAHRAGDCGCVLPSACRG